MELTEHAKHRIRQRGYKSADLSLIEECGTPCGDGILMRQRDAAEGIRRRKREIAALERLQGTLVVIDGESVLTVQRARRWKQRAVLRRPEAAGPRLRPRYAKEPSGLEVFAR